MSIHKRGVYHDDFSARNVLVDNLKQPTRLVIIGFEYALDNHVCGRTMDIYLYQHPPNPVEFNCMELWKAAERTRVWTPGEDILRAPGFDLR